MCLLLAKIRIFANMLVCSVCKSVCLCVCLWTNLRGYNSTSSQHINVKSTWYNSLRLNYRPIGFDRSMSKVKVTGVTRSTFGYDTITQKVFIQITRNLVYTLVHAWARHLLMGDLEGQRSRSQRAIEIVKFAQNRKFPHFSS